MFPKGCLTVDGFFVKYRDAHIGKLLLRENA